MSDIIEAFNGKRDFYHEKGAARAEIDKAEKKLGVIFSSDYREYLMEYGAVSCAGHELTGISSEPASDVVALTLENKRKNPNIKESLYVIEETHIDGIVIWQSESGDILQSEYKEAPQKIFGSLCDYIRSFENDA